MKSQASWDERHNRNHVRWRCEHAQDWCNVPKRNDQPRERKRGFADGFRGRAQVQRDHTALVSTGVQNCAKGAHREAPTASIHGHGDASVFGPNDADRRWALVLWDTGFYE